MEKAAEHETRMRLQDIGERMKRSKVWCSCKNTLHTGEVFHLERCRIRSAHNEILWPGHDQGVTRDMLQWYHDNGGRKGPLLSSPPASWFFWNPPSDPWRNPGAILAQSGAPNVPSPPNWADCGFFDVGIMGLMGPWIAWNPWNPWNPWIPWNSWIPWIPWITWNPWIP